MAKKAKKQSFGGVLENIITRGNVDFILLVVVIILVLLGIIMLLSASSPQAQAEGDSYKYLKSQLKAAILGAGALFALSLINHEIYEKFYKLIYAICIGFMLLVGFTGMSEGRSYKMDKDFRMELSTFGICKDRFYNFLCSIFK